MTRFSVLIYIQNSCVKSRIFCLFMYLLLQLCLEPGFFFRVQGKKTYQLSRRMKSNFWCVTYDGLVSPDLAKCSFNMIVFLHQIYLVTIENLTILSFRFWLLISRKNCLKLVYKLLNQIFYIFMAETHLKKQSSLT